MSSQGQAQKRPDDEMDLEPYEYAKKFLRLPPSQFRFAISNDVINTKFDSEVKCAFGWGLRGGTIVVIFSQKGAIMANIAPPEDFKFFSRINHPPEPGIANAGIQMANLLKLYFEHENDVFRPTDRTRAIIAAGQRNQQFLFPDVKDFFADVLRFGGLSCEMIPYDIFNPYAFFSFANRFAVSVKRGPVNFIIDIDDEKHYRSFPDRCAGGTNADNPNDT